MGIPGIINALPAGLHFKKVPLNSNSQSKRWDSYRCYLII